jgi:N-acetylglucosamine-6-sulfatase
VGRPVDRRDFLKLLRSGAIAGVTAPLASATLLNCSTAGRPNVVILLADDLRWDMAGCTGNPYARTPHVDRLAAEGCLFENAFATTGVCAPSRAGFLTGKHGHQCGVPQIIPRNNTFLLNETPFPALLHEAGYYSAHIGKWHLGDGKSPKPGYDYWASYPWLGSFQDPTLWIDGEKQQLHGYRDDRLAELAADKIAELARGDRPFCLFLALTAPHLPFTYPDRHRHYLADTEIPMPDSGDEDYGKSGRAWVLKGSVIRLRESPSGLRLFGNSWDRYIKSYYRAAKSLDDSLGTVLRALDEAGIVDDTIVIYTSDQGYTLGEHGMTEKHFAYEQVMRIPMVVRYPRLIRPGIRRRELVLNTDVAPTLLQLCGLEPPSGVAGRSWLPLLGAETSPADSWREDFLFEYWDWRPVLPAQLAVRSQRYKLIIYPGFPFHELYDLATDPAENKNVATDPGYAAALDEMRRRLSRLIRETGWKRRGDQDVETCYAMGPIHQRDERRVRGEVFSAGFDPEQVLRYRGAALEWEKVPVGADGLLELGVAVPWTPEHVMLLSIPIRRLGERDPCAILRIDPSREASAYFRGEEIWRAEASTRQTRAFQKYNPPLLEERSVIRMVMPCRGPDRVRITINAPVGSVAFG